MALFIRLTCKSVQYFLNLKLNKAKSVVRYHLLHLLRQAQLQSIYVNKMNYLLHVLTSQGIEIMTYMKREGVSSDPQWQPYLCG